MRRSVIVLSLAATVVLATTALAQQLFNGAGYTLEWPSAGWRNTKAGERAEFSYADTNIHLQIRKEAVETGSSPADFARRNTDLWLRSLAGFVEDKRSDFRGSLKGVVQSYEFTDSSRHPSLGVLYYLQADARTFYLLQFTGQRDTLARMRNQTDAIARSFELKAGR